MDDKEVGSIRGTSKQRLLPAPFSEGHDLRRHGVDGVGIKTPPGTHQTWLLTTKMQKIFMPSSAWWRGLELVVHFLTFLSILPVLFFDRAAGSPSFFPLWVPCLPLQLELPSCWWDWKVWWKWHKWKMTQPFNVRRIKKTISLSCFKHLVNSGGLKGLRRGK